METNVDIIVKSLFAKNSFEEVSEEQILEYSRSFPYTGIGHFLLAKKKKDKGQPYQAEAGKASLYFNNPLWLQFLLEGYPETSTESIVAPENPSVVQPVTEPAVEEATEIVQAVSSEEPVSAPMEEAAAKEAPSAVETPLFAGIKLPSIIDTTSSTDEPLFEPYHTIDYFASQGIRLRKEDLEKDQFGKQLRSFTEWLRAMKKITPITVNANAPEDPQEKVIQKNAAESVEGSEVETEAMAEVWIKQGKKARAAAIYRKLSLLNPAKSHYFAAKIEQLND